MSIAGGNNPQMGGGGQIQSLEQELQREMVYQQQPGGGPTPGQMMNAGPGQPMQQQRMMRPQQQGGLRQVGLLNTHSK